MKANNRFEVAEQVAEYINLLEGKKAAGKRARLLIRDVCVDLSIFDWWNDYLSLSQLKQMQKFLKVAEQLGYNGYVCFKVGASCCAHGMWAYKAESTTGYSPDGECLFHSFRSGDNYYDCKLPNGFWMSSAKRWEFTLAEVKAALEEQAAIDEDEVPTPAFPADYEPEEGEYEYEEIV